MGWRSVVITQGAHLSCKDKALCVKQEDVDARVPLEDISVIVIDHPQVTLTSALLCACADQQIAVITVGSDHHPNGVLLPFSPHSRALKTLRAQLDMRVPTRKQLRQFIVQQKIRNQSVLLRHHNHNDVAEKLARLSAKVRSGDPDNYEAQAAQNYFRPLFGADFRRAQDRFHNATLNYGYAVLRAALARTLVAYGFVPALGLFHDNEQNSFNLADDLIEPFRPILDWWVLKHFPDESKQKLGRLEKATLVSLLHRDISLTSHNTDSGRCTVLVAIDAVVISLSRILNGQDVSTLVLPCLETTLNQLDISNVSDDE